MRERPELLAEGCRFLGYGGSNQYRLWDINSRRVIRAAHVLWDELAAAPSDEQGEELDDDDWEFFSYAPSLPSLIESSNTPDNTEHVVTEENEAQAFLFLA